MAADRGGADHVQPQLVADGSGFDVEIVEHFDVVGEEADRHDHHVTRAGGVFFRSSVANVRLEPGLLRRAAAALIGDFESLDV